MGKNQHSKDRMFITATEWATLYGGKKAASQSHREFKRLPFDACALTFQSFENPMCTAEGHVFELLNILPYIKKHGVNPATGKPLRAKDLTRLHYHKNADGKYHCPVTFKVFNDSTHIVAVRPSGNVYSKDAVDQFNIKAKHWFDLLTDEPFKRADIIDLQDPNHPEKNNFVAFHHVKNPDDDKAAPSTSELRSSTVSTSSILKELAETEETWKANPLFHSSADAEETQAKQRKPKSKEHAAHFSTGQAAASFTSTHMNVHTQNTASALEDDIVRYGKIKSKGYVTIKTNYGDLNVELHCSLAPQTCDNFIRHCKAGYYNDTSFHRSIKSFMIQGGDPTGTGRGGKSAFGKGEAFKDEFASQLSHKGRGVLSMANSGKNTNKSQFFITYRSCVHLDRKHTVFGQVVGHIETLDEIERVPTGEADKPLQDIRILETIVYKDPYAELELEDERKAAAADAKKKAQELLVEAPRPKAHGTGVGKYVAQLAPKQAESAKRSAASSSASSSAVSSKYKQLAAKKSKSGYGNFSGW